MRRSIFIFLFISVIQVSEASPRVPTNMNFAGIKLSINEAARREIQKDVDALRRSPTYFNKNLEKIRLHFPIIERVFREENLPEDFKFLVIQESALISDAVSSSNAVGYWQFKAGTGREVGLRIDNQIDERMNITASSHAAAKYLKKNNFFFDNWIYALMAYNTGPGGAEKHVNKKYLGASKMNITKHTHWYVKKFLAHKIAYQDENTSSNSPDTKLYEYYNGANKSLKEIASFFELDQQLIADYNKWVRKGKIPSDKKYAVIIPVSSNNLVAINLLEPSEEALKKERSNPKSKLVFQTSYKPISEFDFKKNSEYPKIDTNGPTDKLKINGIPGFIAGENDDLTRVLIEYGIEEKKFLKYNDLTYSDKIEKGQVYYLKSKKSKAKIHYHVVSTGESAWDISQKYGIKLNKLLSKNRMKEEKDLGAGMVMWLRFIRPEDVPVEYKNNHVKNLVVKSESNSNSTSSSQSPSSKITQPKNDYLFENSNADSQQGSNKSHVNTIVIEKPEPLPDKNRPKKVADSKKNTKEIAFYTIYHTVQAGETLFSISRKYQVSLGKIRQWNEIDDLDVLHEGQIIKIKNPVKSSQSEDNLDKTKHYKTYTVKKEDTLYSIARKNEISIKDLMDLNNREDFIISEGEILKIAPIR